MKLPISIIITRPRGGWPPRDSVAIEIIDELSGAIILRAEMGASPFLNALTAHGGQQALAEINEAAMRILGMARETKTEFVAVRNLPWTHRENERMREELESKLQALEVDGWEADRSQITNAHYWKGNTYKAGCVRWVPYTGPEITMDDLNQVERSWRNKSGVQQT